MLRKIELQADIVGRQGDKFNYVSPFYIQAGCYINPVYHARITLAAKNASAQNKLADFGYKLSPIGRVCYLSQSGNDTVRSSANFHALVKNFSL